jgi:hypothetical protein
MYRQHLVRRGTEIVYVAGINIAVFALLFSAFELAVHLIWPTRNPWLRPPFEKSALRMANPVYGHALAPNHEGEEDWGSKVDVITNSLGFKDATARNVPLHSDRRRVLFLGDSFTEGLGTAYEETSSVVSRLHSRSSMC